MILPSHERPGPASPEGVLHGITGEKLLVHARSFESMNDLAMRNTLIPYRGLPLNDPAGYIIAYHRIINPRGADVVAFAQALEQNQAVLDINTSYDLGVVFASSLLRRYPPPGGLPVVALFDNESGTQALIEKYLHASQNRPVSRLTANDAYIHKDLRKAVEIFLEQCRRVEPGLMRDGADEVRRGCHDYFGVIALLEAKQEERPRVLNRYLGRTSLLQRIRRHPA